MFDIQIDTETSSGGREGRQPEGRDAQVTVFLNRQRFEFGISEMLKAGGGQHAVLHMVVRRADGASAAISHRTLNMVANTLRAGIRSGAVAYLGDAEFAVLLKDTDSWQAAAYARVAVDIVNSMKLTSHEKPLVIVGCMGGILAGHSRDGEYLLGLATAASETAWEKPGCKVHLLHAPE